MYNLFLDDFRHPYDAFQETLHPAYAKEKWVIVRSYSQFVKHIKRNGLPRIVSFDHDLTDAHYDCGPIPYDQYEEKTGYHCAQWMIQYCTENQKPLPETILIHSASQRGKENIKSLFNSCLESISKSANQQISTSK